LLQDGIVTNDLSFFVRACEQKIGCGARFWEARLRDGWQNTRVKQRQLHRLFNEYRIPNGTEISTVRGNMTDILGLCGLVRNIVQTTPELVNADELALERESFLKCCALVDAFLQAKRRRLSLRDAAECIREANKQHIQALVAAHGQTAVKPKNHWQMQWRETRNTISYQTRQREEHRSLRAERAVNAYSLSAACLPRKPCASEAGRCFIIVEEICKF
jgi:hypothetical protein